MIQKSGRIAESGTKRFTEELGKEKDAVSLIGQFDVGFYSGCLVANKMEVVSKRNSGTRITLHLKDESDQYLDDIALRALIEKYSEFTPFPIELQRLVTKPEQVPDTDAAPAEDGTIPMKTEMKKVEEFSVVNNKKPLWLRSSRECTQEQYTDFYQQTFNAYDEPANQAHFSVEGNVDFKALLFLPSEVPYESSRDMFAESARS